jgi:hypothetical protein
VSAEAFDWLVVLTAWFVLIGVGAFVGMVWESWVEWRRERRCRLPEPNCRARVVRRWRVPE